MVATTVYFCVGAMWPYHLLLGRLIGIYSNEVIQVLVIGKIVVLICTSC